MNSLKVHTVVILREIFLSAFAASIMVSCSSSKDNDLQSLKVCTEIRVDTSGHEVDFQERRHEAVALKEDLWPHRGDSPITITVKFLNGTNFQKQKVMQYVQRWTAASNNKLRFLFNKPLNFYDVRITFNPGGSESIVGIGCKQIPQDQATMNLGWINESTSEIEIQQVILHEFGHVVGLSHEHQSPTADIPWDKPRVYEYYQLTQSPPWDQTKVDSNIFRRYETTETNYTAYDKSSIMHYAISNDLTVGDFETPWNSDLSSTDISFIKQLYPYQPCTVNIDCCFDNHGRRVPCP